MGENLQGFEIKLDEPCIRTGRLSIEMFEKSRDDISLPWSKSGIQRNDNTWLYIQGNREVLFVFPKNLLTRYYNHNKPQLTEKRGTIQTFYLPIDWAIRNAAKVIDLRN